MRLTSERGMLIDQAREPGSDYKVSDYNARQRSEIFK